MGVANGSGYNPSEYKKDIANIHDLLSKMDKTINKQGDCLQEIKIGNAHFEEQIKNLSKELTAEVKRSTQSQYEIKININDCIGKFEGKYKSLDLKIDQEIKDIADDLDNTNRRIDELKILNWVGDIVLGIFTFILGWLGISGAK